MKGFTQFCIVNFKAFSLLYLLPLPLFNCWRSLGSHAESWSV